ncbi:hypothetical protein HYFRA_00013767 [Hymenoscyphus fraxineus]|uniref:Uncharacterized protein n=1 Tax=Hymenoscyphus fraxineus TaxID=746836 RepID=A0A9N9LA44_9HELO|nr:hypothetical protein HYFRA_00013767 [Hymenoscyphus fraxineus]
MNPNESISPLRRTFCSTKYEDQTAETRARDWMTGNKEIIERAKMQMRNFVRECIGFGSPAGTTNCLVGNFCTTL